MFNETFNLDFDEETKLDLNSPKIFQRKNIFEAQQKSKLNYQEQIARNKEKRERIGFLQRIGLLVSEEYFKENSCFFEEAVLGIITDLESLDDVNLKKIQIQI